MLSVQEYQFVGVTPIYFHLKEISIPFLFQFLYFPNFSIATMTVGINTFYMFTRNGNREIARKQFHAHGTG